MSTQSLLHTKQASDKFAYIIGAVAVVALTSGVAVGAQSQPSPTELYAPAATTVRSGVQGAAPITRMGSARQAAAAIGAAAAPAVGLAAPVNRAHIAYAPSTFATSSIAAYIGMMMGAGAMVLAKMGGPKQAHVVAAAKGDAAPIVTAATSGTKAEEGTKWTAYSLVLIGACAVCRRSGGPLRDDLRRLQPDAAFDPLVLADDPDTVAGMQVQKIENDRLAMVPEFGCYMQAITTDESPVKSWASHVALATLCAGLEQAAVSTDAMAAVQDSAEPAVQMPGILPPTDFIDPARLSRMQTSDKLAYAHDAESKHGHVAMLAALGLPVAGTFHPVSPEDVTPLLSHLSQPPRAITGHEQCWLLACL